MPHSVSPEDPSAPDQDAMIAEAETGGETQTTDQTMVDDAETRNGDSQIHNAADQDMEMEDAGVEGEEVPQIKSEAKHEVKLEDLFADMESDEEFPSSTGQIVKAEGSPEAPSSPM
jgi:DNA primase small subunit